MPRPKKDKANLHEIGTLGFSISNGHVDNEFVPELRGDSYIRAYREMAANDSTVGAIMTAVKLLFRGVHWDVLSWADDPRSKDAREFIESCFFDDMSHTWEDLIVDISSMFVYGWAYFEIVYKQRKGPEQTDPRYKSNFDDNRVGIRKIALRPQSTRLKWEFDEEGGIRGMYQRVPAGIRRDAAQVFIPIERALLFRPENNEGNPEGKSILRNAYRAWSLKKYVENKEAQGIDRDLVGTPVVRVPNALLKDTSVEGKAALETYIKIARDSKTGEETGFVIPSDTYKDQEGRPTEIPLVDISLLTSPGHKTVDVDKTIRRHDTGIARSVLAQFILLGVDNRGAFNLAESQEGLFVESLTGYLESIAGIFNRHAIPRVCTINGIPREYWPYLKPGSLGREDVQKITESLKNLSQAGAQLFPDMDLENNVRDKIGVPPKTKEIDPVVPTNKPVIVDPKKPVEDEEDIDDER